MSGEIVIGSSTNARSLHEQVYDPEIASYASVYESLRAQYPADQYPEFVQLIDDASIFSDSIVSLQQESFILFINEAIASLYENIANDSFPADVDIDDVDPIIDEL